MKRILLTLVGLSIGSAPALAQYAPLPPPYGYGTGSNLNSSYHQGYVTPRGTYVTPHYQTAPNRTQYDNYGTRGNYNPYTGHWGTRSPKW